MIPALVLFMLLLLVPVGVVAILSAEGQPGPQSPPDRVNDSVQARISALPLSFNPNVGQMDLGIAFTVTGHQSTLFFTPDAVVISAREGTGNQSVEHVICQTFPGSADGPVIEGADPLPGTANYFTGNDPSLWQTNVPTYGSIVYRDLYPGIDLRYKGTDGILKREFVVAPGADPSALRLRYEGVDTVAVDETGALQITAGNSTLRESPLLCYQEIGSSRTLVSAAYRVHGNQEVTFLLGPYDKASPLVIDPQLVYSTFLGGTDLERAEHIAVDSSGNTYVTGYTNSPDFPTTDGAYNQTHGLASDVFIAQLNADCTALVYSTFLGGSGYDQGLGIAVDNDGNAYITGYTNSPDFPTTEGAYNRTPGGSYDVFVTKVNLAGASLSYSTFLGGNKEDNGQHIAVDGYGNAYVTGYTYSPDFPTTPMAYNQTPGGTADTFVTKLDYLGNPVYSTFLGGAGQDLCYSIAADSGGNAYVTGYTESPDFPTTPGAYNQTFGGGESDGFITKLNAAGSDLWYSTFLGGTMEDSGNDIAVDSSGNAYVTGYTHSADFPTTSGAYNRTKGGLENAFVTKVNPAGSTLFYSTYLGGSDGDAGRGIAVDHSGNAYVTGNTYSPDFPTTPGAYNRTKGVSADAFVTKVNPAGSALLYSTYLGGSGPYDDGLGIAVDSSGNAYITGYTNSPDFPTTGSAFNTVFNGGFGDTFIAKFSFAASNIGLFRPSTRMWYLDYDNNGLSDYRVVWGDITDIPVAGDWDGDNMDEIGLYRPSTQMWYLDYDNNGLSNYKVKWGDLSDIPVAGDWDGDNMDEIGLYRPSTQMWYLDYDNNGLSNYKVRWGDIADIPVAGDWDGDNMDEIGLYRPSTQMWYLDYDNSGLSDFKVKWGAGTDLPVTGRWS
jgi:hypothetical protein